MFDKFRKVRTQLPYLPDFLHLIWGAARTWKLAWSALLLLQGLLSITLVYLAGTLVDGLGASIQVKGWSNYTQTLIWVGLIALLLTIMQTLSSLIICERTIQTEFVQDHIYDLIHAKAFVLDFSFTTDMQTDIVDVMSSGMYIESGIQPDLMKRNKKYTKSWTQQMRQAEKTQIL